MNDINIALDIDDTITKQPGFFALFFPLVPLPPSFYIPVMPRNVKRSTPSIPATPRRSYKSHNCRAKFKQVMRFKIGLNDVKPPVWRTIEVPDIYSFWDLHVAVQDAMGWKDCHLHEWHLSIPDSNEKIILGIHEDEDDEREVTMDWMIPIRPAFNEADSYADYHYDFGDGWTHVVSFEGIHERETGVVYPRCISGERACPPEDVGGAGGYAEFLKIMRNPEHEEYEDYLRWAGGKFDPEAFDPANVIFWNPRKRWEMAFGKGAGSK